MDQPLLHDESFYLIDLISQVYAVFLQAIHRFITAITGAFERVSSLLDRDLSLERQKRSMLTSYAGTVEKQKADLEYMNNLQRNVNYNLSFLSNKLAEANKQMRESFDIDEDQIDTGYKKDPLIEESNALSNELVQLQLSYPMLPEDLNLWTVELIQNIELARIAHHDHVIAVFNDYFRLQELIQREVIQLIEKS